METDSTNECMRVMVFVTLPLQHDKWFLRIRRAEQDKSAVLMAILVWWLWRWPQP